MSERMIQYYLAGKVPTKQVLLAIAILLELPIKEAEELLWEYILQKYGCRVIMFSCFVEILY